MTVWQRSVLSVFALQLIVSAVGCGGAADAKTTAAVSGKVTAGGQAATGGTITLTPQGTGTSGVGKPAIGQIQSDGTFKLTTYNPGDGAVLGKHRVTYAPPAPVVKEVPEGGHAAAPEKSLLDGLVPQPAEVEIKSGGNELKFDLVPGQSP